LLLFCFSGRAAADVLVFELIAFVDKVADDVVKCAVDTVAVDVVVTVDVVKEFERRSLHLCILAHSALLGCSDIDGSEEVQERARYF